MQGPVGWNPVQIDPVKCVRCQVCDVVCPGDIIHKEPSSPQLPEVRYPEECWYCGACEANCPTGAITIVFHPSMLHCSTPVQELLGKILTQGE